MTAAALAERLGVGRTAYANWEARNPKKPNLPSVEGLAALCELLPGLTLDYLYRGDPSHLPLAMGVRLLARERGFDPDSPTFSPASVLPAL